MKPIETFSLQSLPAWYPSREFKRRLVCNGVPTWVVVDGDEIAAQFLFGRYTVLATNYDYFDGVSTWFHLLDEEGKIQDIVATPDYFGFLEDIESPSEYELNFGFYGTNDRWSLRLRERPIWSFRIGELRFRANRFLFSKKRFMLACTKGRPWIFQPAQPEAQAGATGID